MPSDIRGGRSRSAIYKWRVKEGKKEKFSDVSKFACKIFIKNNKDLKLKLVKPNY
jgi:hypothetical protein